MLSKNKKKNWTLVGFWIPVCIRWNDIQVFCTHNWILIKASASDNSKVHRKIPGKGRTLLNTVLAIMTDHFLVQQLHCIHSEWSDIFFFPFVFVVILRFSYHRPCVPLSNWGSTPLDLVHAFLCFSVVPWAWLRLCIVFIVYSRVICEDCFVLGLSHGVTSLIRFEEIVSNVHSSDICGCRAHDFNTQYIGR